MPDVQEVFRMSTQKVRPDQGFTQRQEFRQRRRVRNRKIGTYAVVAAMVTVGGFAIVSTQQGDTDVRQPAAPTSPSSAPGSNAITHWYVDIATGERSPVDANLSAARLLEVSPNGEAVAYNTCCDDDALYVANLNGSDAEMITPETLDGYGPTWIDDQRILFQGRPERTSQLGDLYVADLSTGEVTMVTDLPDERNGKWIVVSDVSPDGTTVLFHLPRGKNDPEYDLWTAPLAGGDPTLLRENAGYAQYAADGSIVFLDHPIPFHGEAIWIMDSDGGNARRVVGEPGDAFTWPRVSPDGTTVAFGHDGEVEIVDIDGCCATGGSGEATGEFSDEPAWFGNDTLIV
jgi:hypothetical protein